MDHLRPAAPKSTKTHKPKVFVSDGKDVPLRGVCCLFTKVADANTVINDQNMIKVLPKCIKPILTDKRNATGFAQT